LQIPNGSTSLRDTVEYFAERTWGSMYEDDKYWKDSDLEDNFIIFYVYCFSYLNLPSPSRAQLEIALFVADGSNPHRLVWAMRSIAKSLSSQIYVIWRLLRNPNEHIIVLSAKSSRARNYTIFLKKVLGLLPITRSLTPRANKERTSGESFDVAGADASDSPSVYAAGAGNTITGMRATLLIIDDVETPITVTSVPLSQKIQDGVDEAHNLLMSGYDESITLATPHSTSSIYIDWLTKGTKGFILPAEYPEDDSQFFGCLAPYIAKRIKEDKSIIGQAVDERLNKEYLIEKSLRIGRSKFKLQYLLDVSESDDNRFPLKLSDLIIADVQDDEASVTIGYSSMPENKVYVKSNGFQTDRTYKASYQSVEKLPYEMKLMSIDPAGKGADEMGITILYTLNTRIYVKKITGMRTGYSDESFNNIVSLCKMHGVKTILTEDNYGDGSFRKMLDPYMIKYLPDVEIVGIKVKGKKEERIIETLEPILNQHRIIMDKTALEDDAKASIKFSFSYQFTHLTKEARSIQHDDRLDSLANGVSYVLEYLGDNSDKGMDTYNDLMIDKMMNSTARLFQSLYEGGKSLNFASSY